MSYELLIKLALTALSVWVVLELARHAGARVAGLAVGLPVTTAPSLVLLGMAHGDAFAVGAGVGGLLATPICAIFALAFAWNCRRGPWVALIAGLAAALATAVLVAWVAADPRTGVGLAFGMAITTRLLVALRLHAHRETVAVRHRTSRVRRLVLPLVIAGVTTTVTAMSNGLPAIACGLLCGLPWVCAAVTVQQHRIAGPASAVHVLRGYVDGLFTRAVFTLAFVLSAEAVGWPAGLAIACAAWAVATSCRAAVKNLGGICPRYFSTNARSIT